MADGFFRCIKGMKGEKYAIEGKGKDLFFQPSIFEQISGVEGTNL